MEKLITLEEARDLCDKYCNVLKLHDWEVGISIARQRDMKLNNSQATCEWDYTHKVMLIQLLDPIDFPPNELWPCDMEISLVHEMLHPVFHPFGAPVLEGPEYKMQHSAIQTIAEAIVKMKRQISGEGGD